MKHGRWAIARLTLALGLFAGSFLIPAPSFATCAFECWPSTWLPALGDCVEGPPDTCRSCLLYCYKPI
jgi:hypothetical protein